MIAGLAVLQTVVTTGMQQQVVLREFDFRDTWIFDIQSQTWKQHTSARNGRFGHTGTATMNSTVVIIGGTDDLGNSCTATFHIRLEPKSLQQLAVKTIYNHRTELSWQCLPKKLVTLLGISKTSEKSPNQNPY